MRDLNELNKWRITDPKVLRRFAGWAGDHACGAFILQGNGDSILRVIATADDEWDHVSVSLVDRCPTWEEMERVAKVFFKLNEHAMQLHLPESEHINCHPYCLHWWRPWVTAIPLPPSYMVGPKT